MEKVSDFADEGRGGFKLQEATCTAAMAPSAHDGIETERLLNL
jgi:hypothetical protein